MRRIFLAILLCTVLSACQPAIAKNKISIELSDFSFTPDAFTIKAGTAVTMTITNSGTIQHDLNIMKLGSDVGGMFDEEDRQNVLWEAKVEPGETLTAIFTVPDEAGSYQVICSMPGHLQAGMAGSIEVVR